MTHSANGHKRCKDLGHLNHCDKCLSLCPSVRPWCWIKVPSGCVYICTCKDACITTVWSSTNQPSASWDIKNAALRSRRKSFDIILYISWVSLQSIARSFLRIITLRLNASSSACNFYSKMSSWSHKYLKRSPKILACERLSRHQSYKDWRHYFMPSHPTILSAPRADHWPYNWSTPPK